MGRAGVCSDQARLPQRGPLPGPLVPQEFTWPQLLPGIERVPHTPLSSFPPTPLFALHGPFEVVRTASSSPGVCRRTLLTLMISGTNAPISRSVLANTVLVIHQSRFLCTRTICAASCQESSSHIASKRCRSAPSSALQTRVEALSSDKALQTMNGACWTLNKKVTPDNL